MGYYAGDYYSAGDPGSALTRFMPGAGRQLARTALRGAKYIPGLQLPAMGLSAVRSLMKGGKGGAAARKGRRQRMIDGMGRRHRRMNVLNPRALRRSLRRVSGFAHFAKRVMHFARPRPHTTRFRFPRRRRKR
jgi:hypothetical protein